MTTESDSTHVRVDKDGAIARVTLTRAAERNAVNTEMMAELDAACRSFATCEQTRAVIFCAQGNDFSIGADLKQPRFQGGETPTLLMRRRTIELGATLMRCIQDIHQPTICAVQGIATGAGACITSACDFRIGATNARIGYGEVRLGINLMWNAVPICVHLIGPSRAKQMIMTGRLFTADILERWGFLDAVVPPEQLHATALAWAEEYAALPPLSVQMIKRSINSVAGPLDRAIMHMDGDQWLLASMSGDFKEAVTAFFEKRTPTFTGD
ncbi:MAG: enoyl-CoA hydratase/isomerase family protein [Alphaproteobacteria bacterium]|nr:enoyl-CoA hydratase/isomerase family protein [Alphaproteobacteria bacterium]